MRAALCVLLLVASGSRGQDWPRFRGPNGAGVSSTQRVLVRWTEKDYDWKVKLPGTGHSSPVIWKDRLFITSTPGKTGQRVLSCLHVEDGRVLWSKTFEGQPHRQHEHNSLTSATPALDDQHVYMSWATPKEYIVLALDHAGAEKWRVDLGPHRAGHGFGVSPIVHGELVVVANEQDGTSSIAALDRATGKTRWTLPRKSRSTYATPCVFQPKDKKAELIFASYEHGITSVDPATGKVNWEIDVFDKGHVECSIASPIVAGDLVLGMSGWLGVRKEVIAVRPPKAGEKPRVVYKLVKGMPLVPTPVVKDDLLFCWGDEGVVTCADSRTGKVHWQERVEGDYYSSPVCVGDHVYNITRDGEVVVLKAAKTFELTSRNPLGQASHATPAAAAGRMFFRTLDHVISLKQLR